jgi:signal transduction histidine kinase
MIWHRLDIGHKSSLFRQFFVAATLTIVISMTLLAYFLSRQLETSMMETAAEEGAILVDVFLGPSLQELATSSTLTSNTALTLDNLLKTTMGERTKALKVWLRDGTLAYATDKRLIGQKFPSTERDAAFAGHAFGGFADTDDAEHQTEQQFERPLIEIYAPIYETGTRDIIAVGEVYNSGARFTAELRTMRVTTASIVGAVTAPMMIILLVTVWRANAIVSGQRLSLQRRFDEAQALATQNDQLRRVSEAVKLAAMHSNERLLGEIGQDLHDGPIQLASILALKLSELADTNSNATRELLTNVTDLTSNILKELRDISTGLVLPELDGLTCAETIKLAVRRHERNTATYVTCEIDSLSFRLEQALQVCVFRVVQECLNNAYAHGDGQDQHVTVIEDASSVTIIVGNSGITEFSTKLSSGRGARLGLLGLRRRVMALGGSFFVEPQGDRMKVTVTLPISKTSSSTQSQE